MPDKNAACFFMFATDRENGMDNPIIETIAGVGGHPALASIVAGLNELMRAGQANCDAVLSPREPGGISHSLRLALACRIARLNGDARLAAHYQADLGSAESALADPTALPPADPRQAAMLRHVDLVTRSPREATRRDIDALREAGVAEADIVRLSQVIAFVNYQLRVIAGLRLLGAGS